MLYSLIMKWWCLAIGIDDMFIMNACWSTTDDRDTVAKRMSDTLAHAGVAVSITNITDVMSFAIGKSSSISFGFFFL